MSHYRRRAGLSAPLIFTPFLRTLMGCFCLYFSTTAFAQAPASSLSSSQRNTSNFVLIPDRGSVSVLKLDDQLRVGKPISDNQALTFTFSDSIQGIVDREMKLKGRAQIRRNDTVLKADEIIYHPDTDIADLIGNAEITKGNISFKGPKASFRVDARQGEMLEPQYEIRDNGASGKANKLTINSSDFFVFDKATYTTCSPDNLDWYFSANSMEVDNYEKRFKGTDGVMHFFDVPIAYLPYFSGPTSNERRSGLLAPVGGYNSNNGFDVTQPYYFNIAPNRDFLFMPRYMSERGTQVGGSYRYIDPKYSGTIVGAYLPNDMKYGRDRWKYDWQQRQSFAPNWNGYANISRVSDNAYPIDFSRSLAGGITSQFRQEVGTTSSIKGWNVSARALTFQTLQPDPTMTVQSPYNILPQVVAAYNSQNASLAPDRSQQFVRLPSGPQVSFVGDFTRFAYDTGGTLTLTAPGAFSQADRSVVKAAIGAPITTPGYYVKPRLSIQSNMYNATAFVPGIQPAQGFTIPTISLDSGLAFEREAAELKGFFGRDMLVTMEPRAFYVYTPFQDQSATPLFDTADTGFGITQIFSENTFVGNDRVADNNKLTMGVTSRMIEAATGAERANFTLAQRQAFSGQRVGLTNTIQNPVTYSDTLGAGSVRLMGNFNVDVFGQYNTQINRLVQTTVGGSWRPTMGRSLNFGYRNVWSPPVSASLENNLLGTPGVTTTDQYNISGQWPITRKISTLGRWGYDTLTLNTLNLLAALEYKEDCWTARFAYSQIRNTTQITTTQVLFQIEFRGFGAAGGNPVDIMRLNVPGYMPTTRTIPPSIYENYQ